MFSGLYRGCKQLDTFLFRLHNIKCNNNKKKTTILKAEGKGGKKKCSVLSNNYNTKIYLKTLEYFHLNVYSIISNYL